MPIIRRRHPRGWQQWVGVCGLLLASALTHADEAQLTLGRQVFTEQAEPACSLCHTLQDAGATGEIGPNLDTLKPSAEQVAAAVRGGVGIMPAFADILSEEQIDAVAQYVHQVTTGQP